ncbi:MAG: SHOCT domain-containing protein [Ktedonobacteraceae bacterium]|nr:SHOCT domain-containing protein [Ktedonobacteraceae bacterium]MBO0789405.1 SHOCT domain-containing protein [Ktedonobacteraceae bacterium]
MRSNAPLSEQARNSIFVWGLMGGGILAVVEVIWYSMLYFGWIYIPLYILNINIAAIGIPVLIALAVFFWISQQPAHKSGFARAGVITTLQACAWWSVIEIIQIGFFVATNYDFFFRFFDMTALLEWIGAYILSFLLMFGAGWWMGMVGGRLGSSRVVAQVGLAGSTPGIPSEAASRVQQPVVSKRVIATFYILGVVVWIVAAIVCAMYLNNVTSINTNWVLGMLVSMIVLMVLAGILNMIAWISTLINLSRAQAWVWFVLTFFFGGILIFIYLVSGQQSSQREPYTLVQQGSAVAPYNPSSGPFPPASQPQQLSALEILQQRYARGEIDAPAFQQMRAQLEHGSNA